MTSADPEPRRSDTPPSVSSEQHSKPRSLRRHVEGWPLLALSVSIALLAAALAVPRPVPPKELPVPEVDRKEQRRASSEEQSLADAAGRDVLPFEVRALGEAVRRYGLAEAAPGNPWGEQLLLLRESAQVARAKHGDSALLRLRAVQGRLFSSALGRWEANGKPDADLNELGGSFLERARSSSWIEDGRIVLDEGERAVLFRIRWSELTALIKTHPFRPSLNDWRIYYRLLLEHPDVPLEQGPRARALAQLRYAQAMGRLDPEFPAGLALGVLSYQLGHYADAASAFEAHIDRHPQGSWSLRARNHLAASLQALKAAQ